MIKSGVFFACLAFWSYGGGVILSAILGTAIGISVLGALVVFEERFDGLDRLCLGGLAGAMFLTTPALFWPTPFDAWSFNLSRGFLAVITVRRFAVPAIMALHSRHRGVRNATARRHRYRDTK